MLCLVTISIHNIFPQLDLSSWHMEEWWIKNGHKTIFNGRGLAFDFGCPKECGRLEAVGISRDWHVLLLLLWMLLHHVKKSNIEDQVERGLAISVTSDIITGAQSIRTPSTSQAPSLLFPQRMAEELPILPPHRILKYNCCFNLICSFFVLFWQQVHSWYQKLF